MIMAVNETKKCRIVPKKNRFVPDLLLHNQRIETETTMEINKAEIIRAMSLADVYMVNDDGTETLLTPKNFYVAAPVKEETDDSTEDSVVTERVDEPETNSAV